MITSFIGVLFDGLAVTMGLMNFINLAHGAFAMLGGYAAVIAMSRLGIPFLPSLVIAFVLSGAIGALATLLLTYLVERTRFGAQIRASVDNQQASVGLGINVERVFSVTFALGSALAGLGGGLGIDVLGLDPTFPLKYMVYFLLVVAVGGAGTIRGPLIAALLLGVLDVAGKYYVPQIGSFVIYAAMVLLLLLFPSGLVGRRV